MDTNQFRPVLIEQKWSVERHGTLSRVTCEIALVLDDATDAGAYETRLSWNGELFYRRVFDTSNDAAADAGQAFRDLLAAGWHEALPMGVMALA